MAEMTQQRIDAARAMIQQIAMECPVPVTFSPTNDEKLFALSILREEINRVSNECKVKQRYGLGLVDMIEFNIVESEPAGTQRTVCQYFQRRR